MIRRRAHKLALRTRGLGPCVPRFVGSHALAAPLAWWLGQRWPTPLAAATQGGDEHYGIPRSLHQRADRGRLGGCGARALRGGDRWRVVPTGSSRPCRSGADLAELQAFLADSSPTKKADLVARLLGDDYVDEYSRQFHRCLDDRPDRPDVDQRARQPPGMRQYLRRAFSNIPYDRFMEELVTATGVNTNRRGVDGFNGATNFLTARWRRWGWNGVQATAKTAQIFLGPAGAMHPVPQPSVQRGQAKSVLGAERLLSPDRGLRRSGRYGRRRSGSNWSIRISPAKGAIREEAELYYELRNGLMKVAYPVFVDGTEISPSGFLPGTMEDWHSVRRQSAAGTGRADQGEPLFPMAIVNRMWGHFLGYGFTKPGGRSGRPQPSLSSRTARRTGQAFREHSYDLKELIRWIVLCDPTPCPARSTPATRPTIPRSGSGPGSPTSICGRCRRSNSTNRC